jgi:hypothetical protein
MQWMISSPGISVLQNEITQVVVPFLDYMFELLKLFWLDKVCALPLAGN